MKRHDTPPEVALALSRHAPHEIRSLLDPAVGGGNLISPLAARLRRQSSNVYCVDSDRDTVVEVSDRLQLLLPPSATFIHSDFLAWSSLPEAPRFDCIVMNPPFAASKSKLCRLDGAIAGAEIRSRHMPLEAAFMCRAIDLLLPDGRLLAIVPCSIVMSESLQWLRKEMFSRGAIRFVHELPPRTFSSVESRMYLMVFDKGRRQRQISLLNHDLREPERLEVRLTDEAMTRLDFGFVNSGRIIERLRSIDRLDWTSLSCEAQVIRGDINSPLGPQCVVHSTDFRAGYWRRSERHDPLMMRSVDRRLIRGDILISRVGRNAYRSCGLGIQLNGMSCSDCVLIIRPNRSDHTLEILFALRIMLSQEWVKPLLMRGTGASYISHSSLLDLPIPMGASRRYPSIFQVFASAERARTTAKSQMAIQEVSRRILRSTPRC